MAEKETKDTVYDNRQIPKINFLKPDTDFDDPFFLSEETTNWFNRNLLALTLLGGAYAMKMAGITFLPKNYFEPKHRYLERLEGSTLLNAFKKTSSFLTDQVFEKDLVFSDDVPDDFFENSENIDGKGTDINSFAKKIFFEGISEGAIGILLDAPVVSEDMTEEERKEEGLSPFLKKIKTKDVLGTQEDENGVITQIRIKESVVKTSGKFGKEYIEQVRVISTDEWKVYRKTDDGKEVLYESGKIKSGRVLFFPFVPGEQLSSYTGISPLDDLAELNLSHWRSQSDQNFILHTGRTPLLFGKKLGDLQKVVTSTSYMMNSDEDGADLGFVEINGASISAGERDLTDKKNSMALYGLQQLIPRQGNQTATEKALTASDTNSNAGSWAGTLESVLQLVFEAYGEMTGKEFPKNGVSVNKEFDLSFMGQDGNKDLFDSIDYKTLSRKSAFDEFKKRGVYSEHLEWDEEQEQIQKEDRENAPEGLNSLTGTLFGE